MSKSSLIQPRTLRGFRDYLPEAMMPREQLIDTARQVYRSYGFSPIDTPALEYEEILAGKGGDESDKLMYRFEDGGGRRVGMRFDLTVPLARFAAQHVGQLGVPWKRYQIATVWRAEKSQRGRYREFMQCDFDTIGTRSLAADIETAVVIHDLFSTLKLSDIHIYINHRQVLTGLLEQVGLLDQSVVVLRAIDKLAKIGHEKVAKEIETVGGASPQQAKEVLQLCTISGTNDDMLRQVEALVSSSETGMEGLDALRQIVAGACAAGVPPDKIKIDVATARGLDYYTGTVYETFLDRLPNIGSVCSGGRYDNLAKLFTRQELPGIGASLGLDRLLAAMEELGMVEKVSTPAQVFIPFFEKSRLHEYFQLATQIRSAGIGVEVFPEPKKLGQQLKYADRRGFRIALIMGDQEFTDRTCQVKNLATGSSEEISLEPDTDNLVSALRQLLV
tara:strand:+ start:183 stop:1523 length:1341 start_codon:yes stop_codon:yes gene_type:complete